MKNCIFLRYILHSTINSVFFYWFRFLFAHFWAISGVHYLPCKFRYHSCSILGVKERSGILPGAKEQHKIGS